MSTSKQRCFTETSADLFEVAHDQTRRNAYLEKKVCNTEMARAEAMRQLSDMHSSYVHLQTKLIRLLRIQELERERDDIMNIFESQINNALEGLPTPFDDRASRSSTPGESIQSSQMPQAINLRPITRDSHLSELSRFTSGSQAMSVLGAMNGTSIRKRTKTSVVDPMSSVDRLISDKSDGIALRVASIQRKVRSSGTTDTH